MKSLNELCKLITQGVYVIAVTDDTRERAFTAAWVMQVSFNPLLLAFSINPQHQSYTILKAGGRCSVNVLAKHQLHMAEHFGRSDLQDKMTGQHWQKANSGVPVLAESLAYFDCSVRYTTPAGDHELVICDVLEAVLLNPGEPMVYRDTGNMDGSGEQV